jgi:hypothetical protein
MINLCKKIFDAKLIKKILRSLPERFRIKVITIEESRDLDEIKVEELIGSLQTYEFFLPPIKPAKSIALKATKGKSEISSDDEDGIDVLAWNFSKLMKSKRFTDNLKGNPKGFEQEKVETDKKDPCGPKCFECSGFKHIWADCRNLKQAKGKALNTTLSDDSEDEETPVKDSNILAFVSSYDSPKESNEYYSESSGSKNEKDKLQRVYNKLYIRFMELIEVNPQNVQKLNLYETERSKYIERIKSLEEELIESMVKLEKIYNDKLIQMLKGQKCSFDKFGLGFNKIATSNIASTSKTIFVKLEVAETQNACEDKGKAIIIYCKNANIKPAVPVMKRSKSRSLPTCHHCGASGHIKPHCP